MKYTFDKDTLDRSLVLTTFDIGEKQSLTPEGYLYCQEVPIARTGMMQYLNAELEPDAEGGPDGIIHVERRDDDLFSPMTISSFEGKPVVDDHPEEMLHPGTVGEHMVGTMLNVRRGDGELIDHLIADILIYDKDAIAAVRAGKRQVSAGYGADYESLGPGRARQHNIIGNHNALVTRGRCGPSCAIGDEDMVAKAKEEEKVVKDVQPAKKSFMDSFKGFLDSLGMSYKEGENGALTIDESLPSKSGTESFSSVGGDTHIHIHPAGPNQSETIAPTTDAKEDDDEENDTMDEDKKDKDEFMDAMSKAFDAGMKKMRDKKGMKDKKGAKDAKEDEDEDDKDTKDAEASEKEVAEEGDDESEGSVKSKDAEPDEDEDDKKKSKDKKTKDTKDSAPLKDEFKLVVSQAEIIAPGLKMPTFDSAMAQTATMDGMCLLRRRALAAHNATDEGKETLTMLNGGKALDLKKLTCDSASVFFNSAVSFQEDRNTRNDPSKFKRAKNTRDKGTVPKTPGEFNNQAAAFYEKQKPTSTTKSA